MSLRLPERFALADFPTPSHEAGRLRVAIGPSAPRIWLKGDDLTGLALGGHKVRKLKFIAAEALSVDAAIGPLHE